MRWLAWVGGLASGVVLGIACGLPSEDCTIGSVSCPCTAGGACDPGLTCVGGSCILLECPVGAEGCPCTGGGVCDPGLTCDGGTCVGGPGTGGPSGPSTATDGPGTDSATDGTDSADTGGLKLDVGAGDTTGGVCMQGGCTAVDMLFAIDSSLSMSEEIAALSASQAFSAVVEDLEGLNCGSIDYRIGLTNDNDGGFIGVGANGHPWFDSGEMPSDQLASAFTSAANTVLGAGGTAIGCEHVLSSSLSTLALDTTGFLRPEALLVLVLITDVDDYGYYDQAGSGFCQGLPVSLCPVVPQPVDVIYDQLVALKDGDPQGLAAIVVAGDPGVTAGANLCGQPASCCGGGFECGQAHHAPRLWDFADMQAGTNGFTGNICQGAAQIPLLIQDALANNIDLACQAFEPPG
ncbi:MAG: hypothetical protein KDK70_15880 [Myxococcales bacterium]|nr:hypothetical protein [Myxococcales bacterium]